MLLIKNAFIKTISGDDIFDGSILIDDNGKIAKIGKDITDCDGAEVIDADGRLVTPGLIDAHTHLGIWGLATSEIENDISDRRDFITPEQQGIDSINPMDRSFSDAVACGITTAGIGPGSAKLIAGTFAAVKLRGKRIDDMIIKNPVAMKCAFGENPKSAFGGAKPLSRMTIAAEIRLILKRTQMYIEAKENGEKVAYDNKLEAMIPVLKGEIPLKAHVHRSDDIFTAIRIAKEFGIKLTIDHCSDGGIIADEIAKEGFPVVVGPLISPRTKLELRNKSLQTPGLLAKAGAKVCITTDAPVTAVEGLTTAAGLACREGLDYDEAWRAITINPAEVLGISDRVGSLEVGKDADIVIWDADPLKEFVYTSYMTFIDGKLCFQNDK